MLRGNRFTFGQTTGWVTTERDVNLNFEGRSLAWTEFFYAGRYVSELVRRHSKKKGAIARALTFCGTALLWTGKPVPTLLVPDSVHERPQFPRARWMAQLAQRLGLDLADAFAGYCERLADFLKSVLRAVFQPEAHLDNLFFAWG